jgi:hypothetical protein
MKKSTLAFVLLASLLSVSDYAAAASTNYDGIFKDNDDNTVTIVGPKFSSANGSTLYIGAGSSASGACRLFGYGRSVDAGNYQGDAHAESVRIGEDGYFSSFVENEPDFSLLTCATDKIITVGTRFREAANDDTSYTILQPRFRFAGRDYGVSVATDFETVCRFYGYTGAVAASAMQQDASSSIRLDQNFKMNNLVPNEPSISSLICRRKAD